MPVFFYIDPEFDEDPRMARVDTITLSYTFFEAKEGQKLPLPGYSYNWSAQILNQERDSGLYLSPRRNEIMKIMKSSKTLFFESEECA